MFNLQLDKKTHNFMIFRVGSVSKPITAAAIMMLIDRGKFKLDDKLFGMDSIFGIYLFLLLFFLNLNSFLGDEFSKKSQYKRYVTDVTVRHLLEHTAGNKISIYIDFKNTHIEKVF